jgi:hypothetical protein
MPETGGTGDYSRKQSVYSTAAVLGQGAQRCVARFPGSTPRLARVALRRPRRAFCTATIAEALKLEVSPQHKVKGPSRPCANASTLDLLVSCRFTVGY